MNRILTSLLAASVAIAPMAAAAQSLTGGSSATLPLSGANGGTGVVNSGDTITLAGNLVTTGAFNTTLAQSATTIVTLPATSSTMARTDAAQTFTGIQTFGTPIAVASGGSGVANTGNLTWNAAQTFTFTSAQTMTFPSTSATLARTDAAQTFTGAQNFGTQLNLNAKLFLSSTAPTIANGGGLGTVGTIVGAANSFDVTAGTGAASVFVITLPAASNGWVCNGNDITTHSTTVSSIQQTVGTNNATTVTMGAYSDVSVLSAVGTSDHIRISCIPY